MEPSTNNQPGFELPAPQSGESPGNARELPSVSQEQPSSPSIPQVAQPAQQILPTMPPSAANPLMPQPATTPQIADDVDLIEKEWVEKAKAIVSQTRNDPHAQNKEMTRFKADYLKKRYNKEIKLEEV